MKFSRNAIIASLFATFLLLLQITACSPKSESRGTSRATSERLVREQAAADALDRLYHHTPAAERLGRQAAGVLVFPKITKGGFVVGGQFGNGVLFKNGRAAGHYNSLAASYGLQAGVQRFGYAMFFMTENDLDYLEESRGWEVGIGPNVTVVDAGIARSLSTTSARDGVYVFFFEQRGLMAGLGIQGTKITKTDSVG